MNVYASALEAHRMEPVCLVVGAPGVGKYTLIRSLQLASEARSDRKCTYKLRLDTKYYAADVIAQLVSTQYELPPASQIEALVLCFDSNQQSTFNDVRKWAVQQHTDDVEVKLVVANKADTLQQANSGLDRPAWLQDAMNWCYDSGYEYVEAAPGRPEVDTALQLDGEQQGVARVLAALQAHMWPGMVMKEWRPALATGSSGNAGSNGQRADQDSNEVVAAVDVLTNGDAPPKAVTSSNSSTSGMASGMQQQQETHQQQQQHQQQHIPAVQQAQQHVTSPPDARQAFGDDAAPQQQTTRQQEQQRQPDAGIRITASGTDSIDDADEAEAELELDMDDFEKLMRQVQGMRTQLSGLAHADRRAAAAEMALKLANMMGLGDEEEGSSEGEDVLQRDVHCS